MLEHLSPDSDVEHWLQSYGVESARHSNSPNGDSSKQQGRPKPPLTLRAKSDQKLLPMSPPMTAPIAVVAARSLPWPT